ncbi:MAG: M20/M25/M40 family metallo-hydrolase [Phycisphaerales bacterium]|nr:M20/M25/M40 family metallo-hydrolase [Phycisphaerales bacterium]
MKLSETEQRVADVIAQRSSFLLEDLRLHVGIPTGGNNQPAIEETRERFGIRLQELGAKTHLIQPDSKPEWLLGGESGAYMPPTAVCERLNGASNGRVMIAGHLDTVHDPNGDFLDLNIAPGGKTAIGPGCVDMKGGLVIAVAALEALEECGVPANWTFTLNGDEETGTYHSENALREQAKLHDFGLALEPALPGGELAIERMGSGQFMIETIGKSAHVGRAFTEGRSAVIELARCILESSKFPEPDRGKILNIGPLKGGVATNAVPDSAAAWGNVRFADNSIADELAVQLDALQTDQGEIPGVIVRRSFNRPAKPLIPEVEALGLRARSVAEALGQKLPFASTGGVCDGNVLQSAGLPTIDTLGVRGGGLHTPDEWIDLTSLVERCQLLAILVARLSAGGSE